MTRCLTCGENMVNCGCPDTDVVKLRARVKRLEEAILRHRRDVWGEGPVGHPEDVALYQALEEGK